MADERLDLEVGWRKSDQPSNLAPKLLTQEERAELKRLTDEWLNSEGKVFDYAGLGGRTSTTFAFFEAWQKLQPLLKKCLPALLSNTEELEQRVARLEKALDQALSSGVAPKLPRVLDIEDFTLFARDMVEARSNMVLQSLKERPFGDDTVVFFAFDDFDYPVNCPELAAYLKERASTPSAGDKEGHRAGLSDSQGGKEA